MTDKPPKKEGSPKLRQEAERKLMLQKTNATPKARSKSKRVEVPVDTQGLLHELEVHQIELEMQNAELKQTRDDMALMLEKYMNLYDFAPVGYLSMTPSGKITDVNLTAASLLELERPCIIEMNFTGFVAASSQDDFVQFLERVFQEKGKHIIELPITTEVGEMRWVDAQAICIQSSATMEPLCRLALSDITQLKRAAAAQKRTNNLIKVNRILEEEILQRRAAESALKQSERRKSSLLLESQHMQEQLRELSHEIMNAQEAERRRISVELHDEISQALVGVNMELGGLLNELFIEDDYPKDKITGIQELVENSIAQIHRFAMELRPTVLDDLGLEAAANAYISNFRKISNLEVQFSNRAQLSELATDYRTVLYRIIQAATVNTLKHAQASEVNIEIFELEDQLHLKIHDNGKSFDVNVIMEESKHRRMGIVGMRERVESVGGTFGIQSSPDSGTTISVKLPFACERRIQREGID